MWMSAIVQSTYVFSTLFTQGQKAGLHLDTNGVPQPSLSVTAPPNLQPFFDDMSDSESQSSLISSLKVPPPPHPPTPPLLHRVTLLLSLLHTL